MTRFLAAVLTSGALFWSAALLLAPTTLVRGSPPLATVAGFVYQAAGLVCHQRPERSFHLADVHLPVCARCLGLYISGAAAAAAAWGARSRAPRHARAALLVAAVPTAATVALEFVGLAHPSNTVRMFSSLPLGSVIGWVLVKLLCSEADAVSQRSLC